MKLLIQSGANISLQNRDGLDALEIMNSNGRARHSATKADFDEVLTTAIQRRLLEFVSLAEWAGKLSDAMTPYATPTNEVKILRPDDLGDMIQRSYSQLASSAVSDAILRSNMAFGKDDFRSQWVKWTMSGCVGASRVRLLPPPATDNPMGKLLELSFPNGQYPFFFPTAGRHQGT